MTYPSEPVPIPAVVGRIAAGRPARAVWVNELGGVTFALDGGAEFVKVYPDAEAHLLAAEVPRLRWARRFTPVPEVLTFGPSWVPDTAPPAERPVVCHGDACAPNTLMADDGTFSGHVDLGDLGVADRWADLAIATLSLDWNFPTEGPAGFQQTLLDAYGIAPDAERIAYYRWAWDASEDDRDPLAG